MYMFSSDEKNEKFTPVLCNFRYHFRENVKISIIKKAEIYIENYRVKHVSINYYLTT